MIAAFLKVRFVTSMRVVGNRQLVHHTNEDDALTVRHLECTRVQKRRVSMKHVVLSPQALASKSSLD